MATKHPPLDYVERDLASAQLDELSLTYAGLAWPAWRDAVLDWHLQRFATAQAEAWIPGFAGNHHDPVIRKLLSRFHRHHLRMAIQRLRTENVELRRKVLEAAECARFYAAGSVDAGGRANTLLRSLVAPRLTASPAAPCLAETPTVSSGRSRHRELPRQERPAVS